MRIDTNKKLFIRYISNNLNLKKIIEHGNPWNCKLSTLKELDALPKEILIPLKHRMRIKKIRRLPGKW